MDFKSITSHEEACKVLNKDASQSTTTDQQLVDIANAINSLTGFKADFSNTVRKWRPFFYMDSSGFRFSDSCYVDDLSFTRVGSRLCHYMSSEAEADHYGQCFIELHKKHYLGE